MENAPSLPVLRALQRTGSVSKTAIELGVTQSAISRSISKYESAIGLTLLHRDTRPLTLTEQGKLVAAHAHDIEGGLQTLASRLKAVKQGKAGEVRIGSFGPSASTRILPDLLFRFNAAHPEISVSIMEGTDHQTRKDLIHGNVDIAVLADPVEDFDAIPVAMDHLVALLPEGSALSALPTVSPTDMQLEPFVMTLAGSENAILDWFGAAELSPRVKHRIQQTHSIMSMVRAKMGVAIVASLSLPDNLRGITIKPLSPASKRQISVMKKAASPNSHAAALFWAFLDRKLNQ